jgi:hypothetical protein
MALVHHSTKGSQREKPGMPDLDDLSGSGCPEWARQWILLNRQEPMRRGVHKLAMRLGGSAAGDLGEWLLEVDEGRPDGELLTSRTWAVTVTPWDDAKADAARQKADVEDAKLALDVSQVRSILLGNSNRGMSKTAIRNAAGFNSPQLAKVLAWMTAAGELEESDYSVGTHKPKPGGVRLVENGGQADAA